MTLQSHNNFVHLFELDDIASDGFSSRGRKEYLLSPLEYKCFILSLILLSFNLVVFLNTSSTIVYFHLLLLNVLRNMHILQTSSKIISRKKEKNKLKLINASCVQVVFRFFFFIFCYLFFALCLKQLKEEEIQVIIQHWIRTLKIKLGWIKDFDKLVVNYVTFNNCQFICSGSTDQTVCVWYVDNNKQIQSFNGHSDRVFFVKFSSYHYHNYCQN
ncbi:hypothetical protein RFI_14793, partial [Reticulomyxa filosa]